MRSMAACMLLAAATATTRDKAERVEAIINQTMEVTEPSLAMLSAYRAAIKSLEYLGQNFIGATVVATDALRRYLCEPSPLLCAMAVAGTAPGGAEHYAACELLCADAVSALAKLLRQSSAKQRNAGRIFVTSLPLPRPPAAGDTATQISHRLLYCNSVQLMTAVTEAVAAQEPDCATQAANLLYQRLHGGPSGCETETLLALARVGAAGPPVCFDSVLEMLLALALGMSHPPPSSSATAAATSSTVAGSASTSSLFPQPDSTTTALYRSLEKDDALVTAFQKLFTKARSTSIKVRRERKVLEICALIVTSLPTANTRRQGIVAVQPCGFGDSGGHR